MKNTASVAPSTLALAAFQASRAAASVHVVDEGQGGAGTGRFERPGFQRLQVTVAGSPDHQVLQRHMAGRGPAGSLAQRERAAQVAREGQVELAGKPRDDAWVNSRPARSLPDGPGLE